MSRTPGEVEYSIAAVSKLTGISCHVLRIWERRYAYPLPRRSATNQRRYGLDQVHALRLVAELTRAGRPIGSVIADARSGRLMIEGPAHLARDPAGPPSSTVAIADALMSGELDAGEALIESASAGLDPAGVIGSVMEPLLVEVGERWFRGEASIYQERFATCLVLRALGRMLDDARKANARPTRRALVAAVQGEYHEGGLLILGTMLELSGWRVQMLGVNVPVAELRDAAEAWRPDAVGVSFVLSRSINKRFRELGTIREVPVFVGGRSLMNHKALARRYGLTPVAGPIASALPLFFEEFERRADGPGSTLDA
jgi:methanogenic corrinoid protein MtbC1